MKKLVLSFTLAAAGLCVVTFAPAQTTGQTKALSHAIQTHFRERRAPYPVERTLLVTGILDAEMESRFQGSKPTDTPHLAIAYQPRDYRKMREMGASWKILTEDIPEPKGIEMWRTG